MLTRATILVSVSSTYGRAGAPGPSYCVASNDSVEGFTKAAAFEFAETGVHTNVVNE
jgi:NAD(P)-dependent dehydrogenase (short-subunit alcohol dehydrogenase family)